jgi:YidC/Oxa1 family membrane protein insertase
VFAGLFLLLAAIGWLSARVARRFTPAGGGVRAGSPVPVRTARKPGRQAPGRQAPGRDDGPGAVPAAAAAGAVARLAPYATVVVAAFVPLAAGLYLVTTTAWTLAERMLLRGAANRP